MLYGLHYAVFVEHQTLDRMGGSLATCFRQRCRAQYAGELAAALDAYRAVKYDYVRQVDVHSHWIGLAMLMIVLGVVFDECSFRRAGSLVRLRWPMLLGSVVFPLGVILQTANHGGTFASALAIVGSALVIAGLGAVAVGFVRQSA